jgi:hypothetical protein
MKSKMSKGLFEIYCQSTQSASISYMALQAFQDTGNYSWALDIGNLWESLANIEDRWEDGRTEGEDEFYRVWQSARFIGFGPEEFPTIWRYYPAGLYEPESDEPDEAACEKLMNDIRRDIVESLFEVQDDG